MRGSGASRSIVLLGAAGRLGRRVAAAARTSGIRIPAIGVGRDPDRAASAIAATGPEVVWAPDESSARRLKSRLGASVELLAGPGALVELAAQDADTLVVATPSVDTLALSLLWQESGRRLVVASKELMAAAGRLLRGPGLRLLDSELTALSLLAEQAGGQLTGAVLPASGGTAWRVADSELGQLGPKDLLVHPVWAMGPKITVDSATFVNKMFEILAAESCLGLPEGSVSTLVHPQCRIHALGRVGPGVWTAFLAPPDMDWAIRVVLGLDVGSGGPDPVAVGPLDLEEVRPPFRRALGLLPVARQGAGGAFLVGADSAAVAAFLEERIPFPGIWDLMEAAAEAAVREGWVSGELDTETVAAAVEAGERFGAKVAERVERVR